MHRCATPWQVGGKEEPSCWAEPGRRIHPLFPGECHPQNHWGSPELFSSRSSRSLYLHTKPLPTLQPNQLNGVQNTLFCPGGQGGGLFGVFSLCFGGFFPPLASEPAVTLILFAWWIMNWLLKIICVMENADWWQMG